MLSDLAITRKLTPYRQIYTLTFLVQEGIYHSTFISGEKRILIWRLDFIKGGKEGWWEGGKGRKKERGRRENHPELLLWSFELSFCNNSCTTFCPKNRFFSHKALCFTPEISKITTERVTTTFLTWLWSVDIYSQYIRGEKNKLIFSPFSSGEIWGKE